MKVALLKGNRFNPWHLQGFAGMGGVQATGFRAHSEIQAHFDARGGAKLGLSLEDIPFDTQAGPIWRRSFNRAAERWRSPRIVPFGKRLQGFDVSVTWEMHTDWTASALDAQARYGVPAVVVVWDTIPFNNEGNPERVAMKERARREAAKFVVYTEKSRAVLELEGVEPERIALVPPGVDTEMFAPGERVEKDEFTILFVGWMLPRKGLYVLAEAVAHWMRTSPPERSVKVVVVADGPGKQAIEALLHRLQIASRFCFTEAKNYEEMPEVYRAADLFVLPSIPTPTWEEQFGMSLLEAMSSGVPCVSTHSGAIPEMVGEAGSLVPPTDFVALSEAMQKLYAEAELRRELGAEGRTRAVERFSLEQHVTEWRRVLGGAVCS